MAVKPAERMVARANKIMNLAQTNMLVPRFSISNYLKFNNSVSDYYCPLSWVCTNTQYHVSYCPKKCLRGVWFNRGVELGIHYGDEDLIQVAQYSGSHGLPG